MAGFALTAGWILAAAAGASVARLSDRAASQSIPLRELLREGRWADAWRASQADSDPAQRLRGRVEILYAAGDLGGALRAALEGLQLEPDDRILAWRATQLALTLRIPAVASDGLARLDRSIASSLPPEQERAFWERERRDLQREFATLEEGQARRRAAERRAKGVSAAGLGMALLLLARLSRRG